MNINKREQVHIKEAQLKDALIAEGLSEKDADLQFMVSKTLGAHSVSPTGSTKTFIIEWEEEGKREDH